MDRPQVGQTLRATGGTATGTPQNDWDRFEQEFFEMRERSMLTPGVGNMIQNLDEKIDMRHVRNQSYLETTKKLESIGGKVGNMLAKQVLLDASKWRKENTSTKLQT